MSEEASTTTGSGPEDTATSAAPDTTSEGAPRQRRPARKARDGSRNGQTGAEAVTEETRRVVREYFEAAGRREPDAQLRYYAEDATAEIHGTTVAGGRAQIIDYFAELFAAFPDFSLQIVDLIADGDRAAVHWRATGTFAGSRPYQGVEPNGARVDVRGVDYIQVRDGRLVRNDAYPDNMTVVRQLGLLPPLQSRPEQAMFGAFNARTRLLKRVGGAEPEPVADGVWLVRGGFPLKTMNVYLIADGDGVMLFDAGIAAMARPLAMAGMAKGGITRILLGHGHADHRGAAPALGVPVLCHEDNRADAEGDGGAHYFHMERLNPLGRALMPRMLHSWDGGPVQVSDTVREGDEVAGFRVVDLPGHAPGLIGLWRESDRLALTSDCFYTLDPQSARKGPPRVPHHAFNQDTEQARASIRKLAALDPAAAWPGHADPLIGDVRARLEQAASTT